MAVIKSQLAIVYVIIAVLAAFGAIAFGITSVKYPGLSGILAYLFSVVSVLYFTLAVINEKR